MKTKTLSICLLTALFAGCAGTSTSQTMGANVYNQNELNQRQQLTAVKILDIIPAQIAIENSDDKTTSTGVGAVLGAAAGAVAGYALGGGSSGKGAVVGGVVGGTLGGLGGSKMEGKAEMVEAVTLVYMQDDKTYTSTQAGKTCEFAKGDAYMISTYANETRIQPNSTCQGK